MVRDDFDHRAQGVPATGGIATAETPPPPTSDRAARSTIAVRLLLTVPQSLCLMGCSASPSQDLMGSFFPSWMLCAFLGLVAAVIVRQLLNAAGIGDHVFMPVITYAALSIAVAFAIWLVRFGD